MRRLAVVVAVLWASVATAADPPTVRGVAATKCQTTGACTNIATPSGTVSGDLLLLFCETANQSVTITDPVSGWTAVTGSPSSRTTTRISVFYRQADGTGDDTPSTNDPGNHILCRMMGITTGTWNTSTPLDVYKANDSGTAGTTVTWNTPDNPVTVENSLVVWAAAGADDAAKDSTYADTNDGSAISATSSTEFNNLWSNTAGITITERIDNGTGVGDDGSLAVGTGVWGSSNSTWGSTTTTGPSTTFANFAFNIQPIANTPTPTSAPPTSTGTATQTGTVTSTPTATGTATNTGTVTATGTATNTGTATATRTVTPTQTSTDTVTQTPTHTPVPARCVMRSTNGSIALKSSCTLPEDDGFFIFEKPTPGTTEFRGVGAAMPLRRFYDSDDTQITGNPAADSIQIDDTMTASLNGSRGVQFGINSTYLPAYTSADVGGFGACTNDQACSISAVYDFIGGLPERDGNPMRPFQSIFVRCGPVNLDGSAYYCTMSGGSPTSTATDAETRAAQGCTTVRAAITTFAGSVPSAVPASCALSIALSVNGSDSSGLCAVTSADPSADCDTAGESWVAGDMRALQVTTFGVGCTGQRTIEAEIACGGE